MSASKNEQTPLQENLASLSTKMAQIGILVALLTTIAVLVNTLVDYEYESMRMVKDIIYALAFGAVIIHLAFTDGLSTTVLVSLSH